ncbi:MAG: acyl carrier protein [Deltaproteobacteria bacterium]|nr:acyl carrier protein [Deltaproteobacteria bacterium]
MDTQQRLRGFITENFYVPDAEELALDTPLIDAGIVDSTGMLEVIAFIEGAFGIRVEDRETLPENLGTLGRILAFIARKQGGAVAAA